VQIQNPASDLTLLGGLAVIRSEEYKNDPDFKATIFLHDALFFEFGTNNLENYITLCKNCLENVDIKSLFGFDLKVPLIAEAEYGYNLANTEEI
jgi:DNA polymerase I-like protein with 3'-5' exonuclease and polymerase domains